jgi:hypothetical protein
MTVLPRGIKMISVSNLILLLIYAMMFYRYGSELRTHFPYAWYLANLTFIGIVVLQIVILLRWQRLLAFTRLLIYVLAMLQGLQVMLMLKDLFTVAGVVLVISGIVLAIYFIGVRGYLGSRILLNHFGIAVTRNVASDQ